MSRKGNYWDNAPMESFFGHFKDEVDYKEFKSLSELERIVNHYMNE
jgi:putative transposase